MTIDLAGSSPEAQGSINCGIVQTRSGIQQAFKFLVNPGSPVCGGNFRNLKILVPKGSCFDPSPTAACLHYGPHLMLAIDLVIRALSVAVPGRCAAGHVGDSWNVTFVNARGRRPFLSGESLVGGWGAYPGHDGENALIHSAAGDFKNFPVETQEQRYALRILEYGLREGSGGSGQYRGGLGIVRRYEVLDDCLLSLWFERTLTPAWGLEGGADGAAPAVTVISPSGERRQMFKTNVMPVAKGTVVEARTGGGGGWGDLALRDSAAIAEDARQGLVLTVDGG
jgi:N-methylhydantoinase B